MRNFGIVCEFRNVDKVIVFERYRLHSEVHTCWARSPFYIYSSQNSASSVPIENELLSKFDPNRSDVEMKRGISGV